MRIEYLADHENVIPVLARWHQEEWSARTPHLTLQDRAARLRERIGRRQIPATFVAFVGDQPAGFASLLEHDMETRKELSPWLASVLVAAHYRGQGIGSALSERVVEEARNLGISELFLFTFDREGFYARMGWVLRERTEYLGGQVSVMVRRLAA